MKWKRKECNHLRSANIAPDKTCSCFITNKQTNKQTQTQCILYTMHIQGDSKILFQKYLEAI